MKISFFSNYLNAHQLPLALVFDSMLGVEYAFVSLAAGGGNVGRTNLDYDYPFVIRAYEGGAEAAEAMRHAVGDDIVVFQHMDGREEYVRARAATGKPFFRATERLLKRGAWWRWMPPKIYRTWNWFTRYKKSPIHVLCISGYAAGDLAQFGFPIEKCLKWAYFPQVDCKPVEARNPLLQRDVALGSAQRLIPWKRVDLQVRLAACLKESGISFHLEIAGDGPERVALEGLAKELGVDSEVAFLGNLSRDETAALMKRSDIFLATSNRKEGWGCTVNEAMASGCVLVASDAIGAVPFLVQDGENGVEFRSEDLNDLCERTISLCAEPSEIERLSRNAVSTVDGVWNAHFAAERFVEYSRAILEGRDVEYVSGPMSPCVTGDRR